MWFFNSIYKKTLLIYLFREIYVGLRKLFYIMMAPDSISLGYAQLKHLILHNAL